MHAGSGRKRQRAAAQEGPDMACKRSCTLPARIALPTDGDVAVALDGDVAVASDGDVAVASDGDLAVASDGDVAVGLDGPSSGLEGPRSGLSPSSRVLARALTRSLD